MKRIFVMLALLAFSAAAFAQTLEELPVIEIRMVSDESVNKRIEKLIEQQLYNAFTSERLFIRSERRKENLAAIDEAQSFDQSQYIDEDEHKDKDWGKVSRSDYICIAKIEDLSIGGKPMYMISASINTKRVGAAEGSKRTALNSDDPWGEAEKVTLEIVRMMSAKIKADRNTKEQATRKKDELLTLRSKASDQRQYQYWNTDRGSWLMENVVLPGGRDRFTFSEAQRACEEVGYGWGVPTKSEWETMINYMDRNYGGVDNTIMRNRFYGSRGAGYWWSATKGDCNDRRPREHSTFGPGCDEYLDIERIDTVKNKFKGDTYTRYRLQPRVRCYKRD